ncbi:MAG: putative dehydrogenase [Verrucomicrobiales bacterium]|jgi:predicted dehydrogenase
MKTENPSSFSAGRRHLIKGLGAVAAVPFAIPAFTRAAPNGKLQHASIGVGGMGGVDLKNILNHAGTEVVALCDVDKNNLDRAAKLVPGARLYTDWREMLAKEGDKIDSVNAAIPDHMHAAVAMTALRAGKHVYCQKPLCHDVAEVRALTELSVASGKVTQLGTQHASGFGDRMTVEHLRNGAIGKIKHVYLGSNRTGAKPYRLEGPRPEKTETPPAHLEWDLWLGTAPERGFSPTIYHQMKWRAWQDFGTGWSGDIGCHIFDAVWKGLQIKEAPKSVIAKVQDSWKNDAKRRADVWPQADHMTWVFPGNEATEKDEITFEWFDGDFYPPKEVMDLYPGERFPEEFAMLIGTEGALLLPHGSGPQLLPREKFKAVPRPQLEKRNHYHHFLDACHGKVKNESHFAQSGPMTEAILLGTVAIREPGKKLDWDAKTMTFPNAPEAEQHLRRSYRKGWEIEGI